MALDRLPPRLLVLAAVGAGLAFQVLLGSAYLSAFLDPVREGPGVPVALVVQDDGPRGRELADALRRLDSPVRFEDVASRDAAVRGLVEKRYHGALVVPEGFTAALESFGGDAPRPARVERILNPGAGATANVTVARVTDAAMEAARHRVREAALAAVPEPAPGLGAVTLRQARFLAEPIVMETQEVNAVPQEGANGLAPTYLAMAAWLGGYIGAIALDRFRGRTGLRAPRRALVMAGAAVAQGALTTAACLAVGLAVRDPVLLALVLALGTWIAYALVALLIDVLGLPGVIPAFAILCVGLPASGAIYPVGMLPDVFAAIHPYDPFTWLVEAMRTALYAPGATDVPGHAAKLALVALAATGLSLLWTRRREGFITNPS